MVTVVQENQPPPSDVSGVFDIFVWMGQYWGYLLFGVAVIILGVVIYMLLKRMDEERQERDDVIYSSYKDIMRDCDLQADRGKIRKYWSIVNLFWLGIPLVKKEHSAKVVNYTNDLIGWYRGHSYSMNGDLNLKLYREKFFLFFETPFILKCPLQIQVKVKKKDKNGEILKDEDGNVLLGKRTINYSSMIDLMPNGDIKINCSSIQKMSYFRYPVYLTKNKEIIDLREYLHEDIVEIGQDVMVGRVLATGSQQVEKAMLHNPSLKYTQLSPEKTKVEKTEDAQ